MTEQAITAFDSDGFLSSEMSSFEEAIAKKYGKKLELARETNHAAHKVIYSADIHNEYLPDLLLGTLLARQVCTFQGFVILVEKGLLAQAQILLRNLAETMFIVGATRKDEEFAQLYVQAEQIDRKKSLEAIARDMQRRGEDVDQETKDLIAELIEKIKKEDIKKFSIEQIAQRADLSSYYDGLYRFASMAVHTSVRGLESALEVDGHGTVVALLYGPEVEGLDMSLDYAISIMLYSLHDIASHFELTVDEIETLQKKNQELAGASTDSG